MLQLKSFIGSELVCSLRMFPLWERTYRAVVPIVKRVKSGILHILNLGRLGGWGRDTKECGVAKIRFVASRVLHSSVKGDLISAI